MSTTSSKLSRAGTNYNNNVRSTKSMIKFIDEGKASIEKEPKVESGFGFMK